MSIFGRFKDIMSSNVNALFDSWEDPVKMTDQYLRNMAKDLSEVRVATADVMAQQTAASRAVEVQKKEIAKFQTAALKAAQANNVEHARILLAKKNELETDLVPLEEREKIATANSVDVRAAHDKLVRDMQTLQKRKANIAADAAIAKAQEKVAGVGKRGGRRGETALAAFDRLESKTKERRDKASAMSQLHTPLECDATALTNLYASGGGFALESELEALMSQAGNPITKAESADCEIEALLSAIQDGDSDENS